MLRIYKDSIADDNLVSRGGAHTNDDDDNFNGTDGEAVEQKLILAPAQTALTADIDDAQTEIIIGAPVFDDINNYPLIILVSGENSEIMTIAAGDGTNVLTVQRGDEPISASEGDPVYSAYTYENITIQASGDEEGWFQYAPDVAGSPGSYGSSLSPSDFSDPTADNYTFWRKITVPEGQDAQRIDDNSHKVEFEFYPYS